jgi:hypothetical protein
MSHGKAGLVLVGDGDCHGHYDSGATGPVAPGGGCNRKIHTGRRAPENWFEDAGSDRLSNGSAVVGLDPTFAQTVNTGLEYHVFLTPNGDCKGLYVSQKSPDSFEVRELGGGTSNIAFEYRIMAKRKGYENVRLADKTKLFAHPIPNRKSAAGKAQVPMRPEE